jgi:hypothetical protein
MKASSGDFIPLRLFCSFSIPSIRPAGGGMGKKWGFQTG